MKDINKDSGGGMEKIIEKVKNMGRQLFKMKYTPVVFLIIFNAYCIHLAMPKEIIVKQSKDRFKGAWKVDADIGGEISSNVRGSIDADVSGDISTSIVGSVDADVSQKGMWSMSAY